jgi:hypothetical protein
MESSTLLKTLKDVLTFSAPVGKTRPRVPER